MEGPTLILMGQPEIQKMSDIMHSMSENLTQELSSVADGSSFDVFIHLSSYSGGAVFSCFHFILK